MNLIRLWGAKSVLLVLMALSFSANAGFPNDFSDVTWIDPDISGWAQTSKISVNVSGHTLAVTDDKREVWPRRHHSTLGNNCCNRSLWIFIKNKGRWYAVTFEYMRFGQINKHSDAVVGRQIKRLPFYGGGVNWKPAKGEVYGFMTSGMARFNLNDVNVRERSNIALYKWGVGPTNSIDFEEVARDASGAPLNGNAPQPQPEPEEPNQPTEPELNCERPDPEPISDVNNSHTYTGNATATINVTGLLNETFTDSKPVSIVVRDDRTVAFTISNQTFNSTIASDGTFSGIYTFDLQNLGICVVDINVSGTVNGMQAAGAASGQDSCQAYSAEFSGVFSASSSTEPDYIDLRQPVTPELPTGCRKASVIPVLQLLLED